MGISGRRYERHFQRGSSESRYLSVTFKYTRICTFTSYSAAPESTGIGASKSTGVASIATSGSASVSKKPNADAIAGGVVGGLVGLGIITGLIVFFLLRRRQSNTALYAYATYRTAQDGTPRDGAPLHASPMSQYSYINRLSRLYVSPFSPFGQVPT
jgi:hypothetical protein